MRFESEGREFNQAVEFCLSHISGDNAEHVEETRANHDGMGELRHAGQGDQHRPAQARVTLIR